MPLMVDKKIIGGFSALQGRKNTGTGTALRDQAVPFSI